jgi:hypothetical protein
LTVANVFRQHGDLVHYQQVLCIWCRLSRSLARSRARARSLSLTLSHTRIHTHDLLREHSQQGDFILREYAAHGDMMFIESGIVEAVVINQMTTGDDGVLVVPVSASFCKVLALSVFKKFQFLFWLNTIRITPAPAYRNITPVALKFRMPTAVQSKLTYAYP